MFETQQNEIENSKSTSDSVVASTDATSTPAITSMWVIGYDATTGEQRDFVCCPIRNALFYESKFKMEGLIVRTFNAEELDEAIANGKAYRIQAMAQD